MASLGKLVAAIARAEGIDPDQVGRIARYLRENGLINMKGRGGSAAQMTASDAANLLIGVNASRIGTNVAKIVPKYRDLEAREVRARNDPRPPAPVLGKFGQAFEELITAHITGVFPDLFLGEQVNPETQLSFEDGELAFQIVFDRTLVGASIRISIAADPDAGFDFESYFTAVATPILFVSFRPRSRVYLRHYTSVDRLEQTTITHRTLRAVADCLRRKVS
jgi:hypothetical protein